MRVWRWLRRYGAAECAGMVAALGAAALAHPFGRPGLTAFAAAIAESVAFYGVIVVRDLRGREGSSAAGTVRDLILEFGPAEALDSLLVRPLAIYVGTRFIGNLTVGVMLGKVVADIAFYAVAIVGHELVRVSHAKSAPLSDCAVAGPSREVRSGRELG